jgi:hypothetical protein
MMKKLLSILCFCLLSVNQAYATTTVLESEQAVLQYFYNHNEEPTVVMISHEKTASYEKDKSLFIEAQKNYPNIHFVEINTKNMAAFNHLDDFKASYIIIKNNNTIRETGVDSKEKLDKILSNI